MLSRHDALPISPGLPQSTRLFQDRESGGSADLIFRFTLRSLYMSSFDKKSIDAATAKAMIAAAAAKASEIGVMACISIVDDAGDLKAFLRMDGAAKQIGRASCRERGCQYV